MASGKTITMFAVPQLNVRRMGTSSDTKNWLKQVAEHMNMSPSQLALSSGLAASTITRYLNDKSGDLGISDKTLDAVSQFTGVPKLQTPGQRRPGHLPEPDAELWAHAGRSANDNDDPVAATIAAWTESSNSRDAWKMKGWALELAGVMPGDILIVDENRRPRAGDIVCAQVTDWQSGQSDTVMRLYEPPYILTHSARLGASRPEQVDDDRVVIRGVAVSVLRFRQ